MSGARALAGRAVLVTGASGFIGSHVSRALVEAGAEVHALVRRGSSLWRMRDLPCPVTVWEGDVTDYESVLRCCRGTMPVAIVHLAGDTSGRRFEGDWTVVDLSVAVNLQGTLNLVRGAVESGAPVSILLRAGGLEEYGTGETPYDEAQREQPSSPYSAAQVAATHFCQMLQHSAAFGIVTLRPALVYGPAQSAAFFIPSLILSCLRKTRFEMTSGEQQRDLIFVEDLVDAFLRALTRDDLRGDVINIASGEEHSIRDVAQTIVELTGAPGVLRIGAAAERAVDLKHLVARAERAEATLGWRPTVRLIEGLRRTIAWYRAHPTQEVP